MSLYSKPELKEMGFSDIGDNVSISRKASFYGCENISIGNNVRIDDFCVVSAGMGGIKIGSFIHIAVYTSLIGRDLIKIDDFANLSARVSVYSSNDDYSGSTMSNPTVPDEYKNVTHGPVRINKHVIIGCGSVILPNSLLSEGVVIGALSLVEGECTPWSVYAGLPIKYVKQRKQDLLQLEQLLIRSSGQ